MKIGKDKILHFLGCGVIALMVGYFYGAVNGFWASVIVGALKELLDLISVKCGDKPWLPKWLRKKRTPDIMDFVADVLGAAVGAGIIVALWGWS